MKMSLVLLSDTVYIVNLSDTVLFNFSIVSLFARKYGTCYNNITLLHKKNLSCLVITKLD